MRDADDRQRRVTRVIGYARVSSLEQALGTSLVDQQNAVKAHAASRGLTVAKFYVEAESGVLDKFERREQVQVLMRDVRAGDLILVDKVDRWSRDIEFTYSSTRKIREAGARIYFVGEGIDPETHEGDSMLNLRAMMAREESKRIRLRTVGSRKILRDQGLYVEGLPPVGYKRGLPKGSKGAHVKNTLQIVKPEADLVREVFRRCGRGASVGTISEWLRTKRPERSWDKKLVAHMLHNRVYLGEVKDARGAWIKGMQAAIIEADVFARAQAGLAARRLGGRKPKGTALTKDWLCRSIGVCGKCGAKLSAAYGGGFGRAKVKNYVMYYRCAKKCGVRFISQPKADAAVEVLVFERLVELRRELAKESGPSRLPPKVIDIAALRERLRAKHARIIESYHEGHIDKPAMLASLAKVDKERTHLDAIDTQQKRRPAIEDKAVRADVLALVSKLRAAWDKLGPAAKRETLHDLARRVHIVRDAEPVVDWLTPSELAEEFYT